MHRPFHGKAQRSRNGHGGQPFPMTSRRVTCTACGAIGPKSRTVSGGPKGQRKHKNCGGVA